MNLSGSLVGLALLAHGCFSSPQYAGTADSTWAALVAAPSGPGIWGPPVAPRRAAVELAVSHDVTTEGAAPRASGGLAHVTAGTRGAVQAVFRPVPRLELGPSFEWGFGDRTAASPDAPTSFGAEWMRVGLHLRVHFALERNWALGANLDALGSIIAYHSAGSYSVTQIVPDRCLGGGFLCWDWGTSGSSSGRGRVVEAGPTDASGHMFRPDFRFGLFGGGRLGARVWLLGGALMQSTPRYPGLAHEMRECETLSQCDGSEYGRPSGNTVVGTLWLGAGVDLGRVTLAFRTYTSLGSEELFARSPVGFTLSTRYNF